MLAVVKKYGVGHHLYDVHANYFHHLLTVCLLILPLITTFESHIFY